MSARRSNWMAPRLEVSPLSPNATLLRVLELGLPANQIQTEKQMNITKVSTSVRAAFLGAIAVTLFAAGAALGQAPSPAALSPAEPLNAPGAAGAAPAPNSE